MRFSKCIDRRCPRTSFRIGLSFFLLSCFCFAQPKAEQDEPGPLRLTKEGRKWAEQTLKGLSLEEKVGQMLQVRYYADYMFAMNCRSTTSDQLFLACTSTDWVRSGALRWMPLESQINCSATPSCLCSSPLISSAGLPRVSVTSLVSLGPWHLAPWAM